MTTYSQYLPKGWRQAIGQQLDERLQEFVNNGGTVLQVKEKFGGLRVYYNAPGTIQSLDINDILQICDNTCMECGQPGKMTTKSGWIGPRCEEHSK